MASSGKGIFSSLKRILKIGGRNDRPDQSSSTDDNLPNQSTRSSPATPVEQTAPANGAARYVILGAGPAGVTAAETLRKHDADGRIVLVGNETIPPYSRMAIPYYLTGKIGETGTYLRHQGDHYSKLGIEYIQGHADALDPARKTIKFSGGNKLGYEKLLIASGASPIRPAIDGLDLAGVHTCWTIEDARAIAKLAHDGSHAVLIGAGFIGSIILEALVMRGVSLDVIEMGDRMVPRMMDDIAGNMLRRWCSSKGVNVLTGTRVEKVSQGHAGLNVELSQGDNLEAQLIVLAAGVQPNISFLSGSGIEIGDGIRVDKQMRTNLQDVYAAGDVAEAIDMSTGEYSVLAIQPTAVEHGRTAALNMTGHAAEFKGGLSMNVLDTVGLISSSFGSWMGVEGGQGAKLVDEANYRYLRLEFSDDRLVGAQAIGMTEHIGIIRGLIQTGLKLGPWKDRLLKAPHRISEAYIAVAQGFGAK